MGKVKMELISLKGKLLSEQINIVCNKLNRGCGVIFLNAIYPENIFDFCNMIVEENYKKTLEDCKFLDSNVYGEQRRLFKDAMEGKFDYIYSYNCFNTNVNRLRNTCG